MARIFYSSRSQRIRSFFSLQMQPYPRRLQKKITSIYLFHFFGKRMQGKAGKISFFESELSFPNFKHLSHIFSEVYLNGVYHFRSDVANPVIIDLGANIGMTSIFFKNLYPEASIIAIEADKKSFSFLESNLNYYSNLTLINKAAFDKDGSVSFFSEPNRVGSGQNSTIPSSLLKREIKVKTLLLSSLITKKVDLLKIDIEGGELAVFRDLKAHNSLEYVDKIIMEYHHRQCGVEGLHFILETLEESGFQYSFADCSDAPTWDDSMNTMMIYAKKVNL